MVSEEIVSGQDVLYFIGKHNITKMLENPIMNTIIMDFWTGPYNQVTVKDTFRYFLDPHNPRFNKAVPYSYTQWRDSILLRRILNGISLLLSTAILQYVAMLITSNHQDLESLKAEYGDYNNTKI